MNPYSGLVDLFEAKGLLKKDGNRLKYIDLNGEVHLEYRKNWNGEKLNLVMSDIAKKPAMVDGEEVNEDVVEEIETTNSESIQTQPETTEE